jgi:hypothetical protein
MRRRTAPYRWLLLAGSLTLTIGAAACSSGNTPTATGTLSGRLLRVGGPAPGEAEPLSGSVEVVSPSGERTQVQVEADGMFSFDLPAATYTLAGSPATGSYLPCPTESGVVVTAGSTSSTDLTCHIP